MSSLLNSAGRQSPPHSPKPYYKAGRTPCSLCPVQGDRALLERLSDHPGGIPASSGLQGVEMLVLCRLALGHGKGMKTKSE